MLAWQKTIAGVLGAQIGRAGDKARLEMNLERFLQKIKDSPLLFIQLWTLPAIIHHIIFKVLIQIGPILYFLSGTLFAFLLLIYLIMLVLHVSEDDFREKWHHIHPPKSLTIEKKLEYMRQGYLVPISLDGKGIFNCPGCNMKIFQEQQPAPNECCHTGSCNMQKVGTFSPLFPKQSIAINKQSSSGHPKRIKAKTDSKPTISSAEQKSFKMSTLNVPPKVETQSLGSCSSFESIDPNSSNADSDGSSDSSSLRISEIDQDELDPNTLQYKHLKLYPDAKNLDKEKELIENKMEPEQVENLNQFFFQKKVVSPTLPTQRPEGTEVDVNPSTEQRRVIYREETSPQLLRHARSAQTNQELLTPPAILDLPEPPRNDTTIYKRRIQEDHYEKSAEQPREGSKRPSGSRNRTSTKIGEMENRGSLNFEGIRISKRRSRLKKKAPPSMRTLRYNKTYTKIMKLHKAIMHERVNLNDFEVLQEYVMKTLELRDEDLLIKIEAAHKASTGEFTSEHTNEDGVESIQMGERWNLFFEEGFGSVNQGKENLIEKFQQLKDQNKQFQDFIGKFKLQEKEFSEALKDLKIEFEVTKSQDDIFRTRKRFSSKDAMMVVLQQKIKKKKGVEEAKKKRSKSNMSCSPMAFFRKNSGSRERPSLPPKPTAKPVSKRQSKSIGGITAPRELDMNATAAFNTKLEEEKRQERLPEVPQQLRLVAPSAEYGPAGATRQPMLFKARSVLSPSAESQQVIGTHLLPSPKEAGAESVPTRGSALIFKSKNTGQAVQFQPGQTHRNLAVHLRQALSDRRNSAADLSPSAIPEGIADEQNQPIQAPHQMNNTPSLAGRGPRSTISPGGSSHGIRKLTKFSFTRGRTQIVSGRPDQGDESQADTFRTPGGGTHKTPSSYFKTAQVLSQQSPSPDEGQTFGQDPPPDEQEMMQILDSADHTPEIENTNLRILEKFLYELGKRHQVTQISCGDPILTGIASVQKKLDSCEEELIQKYSQVSDNRTRIEKKLKKHQQLLKEINTQLYVTTKNYLNERKENSDIKAVLELEIKYKQTYISVQDKKAKIQDLEKQLADSQMEYHRVNEEIELKISDLTQESDELFRQIIRILSSNYQVMEEYDNIIISLADRFEVQQQNRENEDPSFNSPRFQHQPVPVSLITPQVVPSQVHTPPKKNLRLRAISGDDAESQAISQASEQNDMAFREQQYLRNKQLPTCHFKKISLKQQAETMGHQQIQEEDFDSETLHVTFKEAKDFLNEIPLRIDLKIQKIQAISTYIAKVSLQFQDFSRNMMELTQGEETENNFDIYEMIGLELENRKARKFNNRSMDKDSSDEDQIQEKIEERLSLKERIIQKVYSYNFKKLILRMQGNEDKQKQKLTDFVQIYRQKSRLEIKEKLQIVKELLQQGITNGLMSTHLVTDFRDTFMRTLIKMEEKLMAGSSEYQRDINRIIRKMERSNQVLFDKESQLQYMHYMKEPDREGSTKNRLSLIMKNTSLLFLQFQREDHLPSDSQLEREIQHQLRVSNLEFRQFMERAEQTQDKLIQIEDDVENELKLMEKNLCEMIINGYSQVHKLFADLYSQINQQKKQSEERKRSSSQKRMKNSENGRIEREPNFSFNHKKTMGEGDTRKFDLDQRQINVQDIDNRLDGEGVRQVSKTLTNLDDHQHLFDEQQRPAPHDGDSFSLASENESVMEIMLGEIREQQKAIEKMQLNKDFMSGFRLGKQEVITVMNQAMKIFWEVWKTSPAFKATVMKDIYTSMNKNRPKNLEEIVITNYEHRGPPPKCYDIKHLTPLLCQNQEREFMADVVAQLRGEIEVCAETTVNIDLVRKFKIPVSVKGICQSLSAKARFYYTSQDTQKCYLQWIGKPVLRVDVEPKIGQDINLKTMMPRLKGIFENFLNNQLIPFEKEQIEIPMTEIPKFVQRYELFEPIPSKSVGCQADIQLSKYRRQILRDRHQEIRDVNKFQKI